jgi:hypothetical protein
MNLAAAIYLYRASAKFALVEKQLDAISSVEERLRSKLDLVNLGIQSQFDKLNDALPGRFNEINAELKELQRGLATLGTASTLAADVKSMQAIDLAPTFDDAQAPVDLIIDAEPSPTPQKRSLQRKKVAPAPSSSYQRTETADGLVHYRKIK